MTKLRLGHSKESVTDFHAGVYRRTWRGDRKEWSERVGLGFGLRGLQNAVPLVRAKAAEVKAGADFRMVRPE